MIRQTGLEGNHRQEITNRVSFGFHPTDIFPLKQHLDRRKEEAYKLVKESTVNKAVKLSIIKPDPRTTGKQNFMFDLQ